ncbi:hypothetical protein JAAARDRAFT_348283 [Jaapia argillacea MUCL 33604]|uniref:Translin n=1 Tax=Jaapia argillacea MUCL 33604 TaxID=933084 RepID=A0A067PU03_9AGAM|nr:hypothetical protein JAAARDRAFT_348283 [Jaapia argillacea MUCL 33604]
MSQPQTLGSKDTVVQLFQHFAEELDDQNDRRERLIKSSRDVTNLSKKVIFLLHRIMTEETDEDDHTLALRAATSGRQKLKDIQKILGSMQVELRGNLFWQNQKNISPGLQEYIEALSFAHYLEHGTLISFQEVQETLSDNGAPFFPLPMSDYLLGLSDLTGELMRYAISAIPRKGGRMKADEVCSFVRRCKADFAGLTPFVKGLAKKQSVTNQSLQKIEDAAYAIAVRTSEFDLPPDILDDIVARCVSGYETNNHGRKAQRWQEHFDSDDEDYEYRA